MFKLPKVAINGIYIQEQASGLGVVSQNLIAELMNFEQEFNFRLYASSSQLKAHYQDRINPVTASISPDRGFTGHIKRLLWYQTSLNWQLRQQQTALFFSPATEGMLFPSVPQIITVHDLIPLKYPEVSPKWQYYYRYVFPLIVRQSRRIICISQHTKQDLIENYRLDPELINVVYLGFDRQLFSPQRDPKILRKYNLDQYLLYVGDMRFYKNLSRSLEAFDRLPIKDCQFVITGKKDDFFYPEVERQVAQLSARDRIIFLDYVPTEDLPGLYSMAQSLVFPSLYEGFGLPVLEAMACGCPVITADATSIPEVGGDSVLYVNPYDVDSIAKAMSQILTQDDLREKLRQQGLKRSQFFSWDKTAHNVRNIFIDCLKDLTP
ncbi:MAG: glycosyltransferase family 1 protein [Cyanobacteria bacterium P01_E01_bin.35]